MKLSEENLAEVNMFFSVKPLKNKCRNSFGKIDRYDKIITFMLRKNLKHTVFRYNYVLVLKCFRLLGNMLNKLESFNI